MIHSNNYYYINLIFNNTFYYVLKSDANVFPHECEELFQMSLEISKLLSVFSKSH